MPLFEVHCTRKVRGGWDDSETHVVKARSAQRAKAMVEDKEDFDKTFVTNTAQNHQSDDDEGVDVWHVSEVTEAEAETIRSRDRPGRRRRYAHDMLVKLGTDFTSMLTNRLHGKTETFTVQLATGPMTIDPLTIDVAAFVNAYGLNIVATIIDTLDGTHPEKL